MTKIKYIFSYLTFCRNFINYFFLDIQADSDWQGDGDKQIDRDMQRQNQADRQTETKTDRQSQIGWDRQTDKKNKQVDQNR